MTNSFSNVADVMLFSATSKGVGKLFEGLPKPGYDAIYEGLILASYMAVNNYRKKSPETADGVTGKFFSSLYATAQSINVGDKIPGDFASFTASRFALYEQCFGYIQNRTLMNLAFAKISFNLYVAPLQKNGGESESPQIWRFTAERVQLLGTFLEKSIDEIIVGKYAL